MRDQYWIVLLLILFIVTVLFGGKDACSQDEWHDMRAITWEMQRIQTEQRFELFREQQYGEPPCNSCREFQAQRMQQLIQRQQQILNDIEYSVDEIERITGYKWREME